MPFSSWQLCLTHEKRTNEARKGFSRGLQGTLSLDYSIIHIINSCVLFMLLKENTRKRWIILVWLLCLLSSQLSHVWGRGWEKVSWSLFIYYCQPAGLDRLLENAPSEFLKFWLLLNRFYILASKPSRQAGECIGGQRGGPNVGTVACLVNFHYSANLGGNIQLAADDGTSLVFCFILLGTPKDHFWILAFFTQSNFSRWQWFQREVDGGELPAAGGGGDREGDGDSAKGEGGNICQMLATYLRN